jgi:pimeloyl-ACP methyl ester carboxylesterase
LTSMRQFRLMHADDAFSREYFESNGIRLSYLYFGGQGQPILILHGLAGQAMEWRNSASWLVRHGRVLALDQRGHGRSDRNLAGASRGAYVADAINLIEHLGLSRVVLIGQSMGGVNAYLVAARRSDLVRALIVIEAGVAKGDRERINSTIRWLTKWPVPFDSFEEPKHSSRARESILKLGLVCWRSETGSYGPRLTAM